MTQPRPPAATRDLDDAPALPSARPAPGTTPPGKARTREVAPPTPGTRRPGLDVLRGVAVLLVIARHAVPGVAAGGGVVGVVMFFTLSGFLITGLLADEVAAARATTGGASLRPLLGRFYLRRLARLAPALLLLTAGVAAVTLLLDPLGDRSRLPATLAVALTWTGDLPLSALGVHPSDATFHLWTLAVEEQFYLLWPVALVVALRRGRVRALLLGTAGACLVATVATAWWARQSPDVAYALPTSWAGCFVVGAAVRLHRIAGARAGVRDPEETPRPGARTGAARRARHSAASASPVRPAAAVGALLVLAALPLRGHWWTTVLVGPAVAGLTAALLPWAWALASESSPASAFAATPEPPTARPLARPLRWLATLGTLSYAAYLWNYPATMWLRPHVPAAGLIAAAVTVPLAWASTRFVEVPARAWILRRAAGPGPALPPPRAGSAAAPGSVAAPGSLVAPGSVRA